MAINYTTNPFWNQGQAVACWWLQDGKMCLLGMYQDPMSMAFKCAQGHKTTRIDLLERKTR